ncbi:serine/threonine transporter SstT [Suttonella sp. R2A3]|uniref:serine/threonine transporter SstT n=1 Tax=Suttonella sp. R2A3 TaxID=2908648 RepID=UPI001F19165D|nr:serine/threonine transporter SstT [Suttonella sp. R2A3]UJF24266.1 serine/threonine transporter SstT [Suttonella sp. R2A3]
MQQIIRRLMQGSLVLQIIIALILGIILALVWPQGALSVGILGSLFVSALKAVAPVLVFILVAHAIAQHQAGQPTNIRAILIMYVFGTFAAALVAVAASYIWPVTFTLDIDQASIDPPSGLGSVLKTLAFNMVDNPVRAVLNANYIGILVWATLIGFALRHTEGATKTVLNDAADVIGKIVGWVIRLAPIGIFGLIAFTIADTGLGELANYAHVLVILVGAMLFVALVVNPIIVWVKLRQNPYPLVFKCLMQSGITAFFMRSSAANIPVNMRLARELELREETYSISIPLGATINMAGAAITITIMTLAAANTLGVDVHPVTAVLLCFLATLGACGASGVPGGSLLLIPMACSLFGIDDGIAAQVVGIGFIIGVVQDSAETGLNSSTDVLFTAAADLSAQKKAGTL